LIWLWNTSDVFKEMLWSRVSPTKCKIPHSYVQRKEDVNFLLKKWTYWSMELFSSLEICPVHFPLGVIFFHFYVNHDFFFNIIFSYACSIQGFVNRITDVNYMILFIKKSFLAIFHQYQRWRIKVVFVFWNIFFRKRRGIE